jgi:tetratricopeptide (TPR) repeat protein
MRTYVFFVLIMFCSYVNSLAYTLGEKIKLIDRTNLSADMKDNVIPKGNVFLFNGDTHILGELDSLWKATNNIEYLSDYGVVLMYQQKYEAAKNVFLTIEKNKSNKYSTASHLSTVYELMGDNSDALLWIQKAIYINPLLNDSSEWLHVKILEAKINGNRCINSDFLLGVNFGRDSLPKSSLSYEKLMQLRKSVFFQLNEQLTFIQPKDKIVAQLLFDLANLSLLTGAHIYAVNDVYSMAKSYGYEGPLFEKRSAYVTNLSLKINRGQLSKLNKIEKAKSTNIDTTLAIIFGFCFLLFPVFAFAYLYRRMQRIGSLN